MCNSRSLLSLANIPLFPTFESPINIVERRLIQLTTRKCE
jgi:hypothetical protein